MWQQDRAPALVSLDQPEILRQVFSHLREVALAAAVAFAFGVGDLWRVGWTRLPACAAAVDHRTAGKRARANFNCAGAKFHRRDNHPTAHGKRGSLHVWRAHEERYTMLAPRSWSSSLLAT